jgi:allantoicase
LSDTVAAASFTGTVDLAAASFGGKVLGCSDEFFAEAANMLQPGRGVFIPDKFTERGKWMDGWESRRKRGPGHDFCIVALGAAGQVVGFDIDTHHFNGNHPAFASVDGVSASRGASYEELLRASWRELLSPAALAPTAQNLFVAEHAPPVTHLRLNIHPDGGVARFRAYGRVQPSWQPPELDAESRPHVAPGLVDLAALENGALALACSDARFSPMNNLILPGRAPNMGGGWETRRSRGLDTQRCDWLVLALGARGRVKVLEIDTQHFKGNYPDRGAVQVIDAPDARLPELVASSAWRPLLPEQKLAAHTRHFYARELLPGGPGTHLRLQIFPDGGVSRLRAWGERDG